MCTSASVWNDDNFTIENNQITLSTPINNIKKITLPATKLMPWQHALEYAYLLEKRGYWKIPNIDELQTVLKIYGILGINNEIRNPVWSRTQTAENPFDKALDFSNNQVLNKDKNEALEVICIHY